MKKTKDEKTNKLSFQLDILKQEIGTVDSSIRQMDDITKSVKNWSIVLWTVAIGGALTHQTYWKFVGFTCFIPLVFWFVDASFRRVQRKFIFRSIEIRKFLNSENLQKSFDQNNLIGFNLFDPASRLTLETGNIELLKRYNSFTKFSTVLFFRTVFILYLCLFVSSVIIGIALFIGEKYFNLSVAF